MNMARYDNHSRTAEVRADTCDGPTNAVLWRDDNEPFHAIWQAMLENAEQQRDQGEGEGAEGREQDEVEKRFPRRNGRRGTGDGHGEVDIGEGGQGGVGTFAVPAGRSQGLTDGVA